MPAPDGISRLGQAEEDLALVEDLGLGTVEIDRLTGKTKERGLTLIALKLYFKNGRAKVEIGLGRGKKLYDKRETLKRKNAEREVARSMQARR